MAVSPNTGHGGDEFETYTISELLRSLTRYDAVLVAIPLLFGLAFLAHVVFPVSFLFAIGAGAVTSAVCLVDVIYLNPPSGRGSDRTAP